MHNRSAQRGGPLIKEGAPAKFPYVRLLQVPQRSSCCAANFHGRGCCPFQRKLFLTFAPSLVLPVDLPHLLFDGGNVTALGHLANLACSKSRITRCKIVFGCGVPAQLGSRNHQDFPISLCLLSKLCTPPLSSAFVFLSL